MQQRPPILARFQEPEQDAVVVKVVEVPHQQDKAQCSPRLAEHGFCQIPIRTVPIGKRPSSRRSGFPVRDKLIHGIPMIVLLCFFILWWFSHPVNVVVKNGKIVAIHQIEQPRDPNDTHLDVAILASAKSPIAESVPEGVTGYNITKLNSTHQSE